MDPVSAHVPEQARAPGASNAPGAPAPDDKTVTSDFETFLRMLTVQMENQDPLNPVKSEDFAVQLATFSGVEQQLRTNELLERQASGQGPAGLADLAQWVGLEARAPMPAAFDGTPLTLHPEPPANADRAELVVTDPAGEEVQRISVPAASEPLQWAGVGADGMPLPDGRYSFALESRAGGAPLETRPVALYATVAEVRRDGEGVMLRMSDGTEIPASEVTGLRMPEDTRP